MKAGQLRDEKGIALVVAMLLLLVLTLIGMSAVNTSTFDILISGRQRASQEAFYAAEAGINEFMGRFRSGATNEISDPTDPKTNPTETSPPWKILLAKSSGTGAAKIGFGSTAAHTTSVASLQTQLDFGVEVTHKLDLANKVIIKSAAPAYTLRSYGFAADGAIKVIEVELHKVSLDPPGALYSERPVDINGTSTYIQGKDQCGGTINKPGILSTLGNSPSNLSISGNPTIDGNETITFDGKTVSVQFNSENLDMRGLVDYLKIYADSKYDYTSNQTLTGYSDQWGTPTAVNTTPPTAISYDGPMKIVYFNMHGNNLKLAGGSHGAGVLLVDGNLELNGGFTWYGVIVVMGALDYTGGGEKNVTGGVLTGESATIEVDVGGNAAIIYCSRVADQLKDKVSPFKMTKWAEIISN